MRGVGERNILDQFAIDFCKVVEKHCKYILVSGFVAISSGRVRATEDIDLTIEKLNFESYTLLHQSLVKIGFVCMQSNQVKEIFSYLSENIPVRYTRKNEPLPEMEMKFAKDKLDQVQIETRTKLQLTGLNLWFSNINMNIAFKEFLLKSDKDMKDAEHLRKIYPEQVNEHAILGYTRLIKKYRL